MKKNNQSGFTLIEFLLGFAILGLMAVSVYLTFANGLTLNRQTQNLEDMYREARWSIEAIAMDLENMIPYHPVAQAEGSVQQTKIGNTSSKNVMVRNIFMTGETAAAKERVNIFKGDESSLTLLIFKDNELKLVSYFLSAPEDVRIHQIIVGESTAGNVPITTHREENAEKKYYLIREERPFIRTTTDSDDDVSREVLSEHVAKDGLAFFYGQIEGNSTDVVWQEEWIDNRYPVGVRAELTLVNPEGEAPLFFRQDTLVPIGAWQVQAAESLTGGTVPD